MYFPQVKTTRTWGQRTLAKKCKSHQYKLKKDSYNIKYNFYCFIYINKNYTYVEGYFQQSYNWNNCFTTHITFEESLFYMKAKQDYKHSNLIRKNTYLFWNYYIYLEEYPLHCGRQSNFSYMSIFFKNIFLSPCYPTNPNLNLRLDSTPIWFNNHFGKLKTETVTKIFANKYFPFYPIPSKGMFYCVMKIEGLVCLEREN